MCGDKLLSSGSSDVKNFVDLQLIDDVVSVDGICKVPELVKDDLVIDVLQLTFFHQLSARRVVF